MVKVTLGFLTAFVLTYFAIPTIIRIAHTLNIWDVPGERSSHMVRTPSLGGIAIFSGLVFSLLFWVPPADFAQMQYLLGALLVLFLVGARDDLIPLTPWKKLACQIVVGLLLVFKAGIVVTSLHGFLGIDGHLPYWFATGVSFLMIVFLINAFNLIDGINGLAGTIGLISLSTFGAWFILNSQFAWGIFCFAAVGSIVGFLKFNFTPAKIFMGDTGSMMLGVLNAIMLIKFLQFDYQLSSLNPYRLEGALVVGAGFLFLPLLDTFRVVGTRLLRRQSPFRADRRHIQHMLIDSGLTHMEATGLLLAFQGLCIAIVLLLNRFLEQHLLLLLLTAFALSCTYGVRYLLQRMKKEGPKVIERSLPRKSRQSVIRRNRPKHKPSAQLESLPA